MSRKHNGASLVKKLLGGLVAAVFVVLCGAMGFLLAGYADRVAASDGEALLLIFGAVLLMMLSMLMQIIIHEGGHMVFGLLTGYSFVSFNVLGFIWKKEADGKLRFGRMKLAGAGGQCLMSPPDWADGRYPYTLYNMGGVLMNLIVSAVCFLGACAARSMPPLFLFLMSMGVVGVFFAVTNGLPIPIAAIQNDGGNQRCINRDDHARRAFWVQMTIAAELAKGKRLRELPDAWFAPFPEDRMDNPIVSAVAVMAANRRMDALDFAGAEKAIRTLLARRTGILGLYRMVLTCDGATCELIAGRPAALTQALEGKEIQQLMNAMKANPAVLRTRYAVALLRDRNAEAAETLLKAFDAAAPAYPNPQEIDGERELLACIDAAAKRGGECE